MKGLKKLFLLLALSLYIPSAFACACNGEEEQPDPQQVSIIQGQKPSLYGDNNSSDITNIDMGDASTTSSY